MMSNFENNYDDDQEISKNHSKFIDAVKKFDKDQRIKKPDRNEAILEVSEFHLMKSGIPNQNVVEFIDLAKTLGEKGHHTDLGKKLNATKIKANFMLKPVQKTTAEKIKRSIGFKNSKKELARWTGIVARNRTASSVTFPLSQSSMKLEYANEYSKQFYLQSELEQKFAELDPVENIKDDEDNFVLTLQEILKHRKEVAKFRAQQSYKEAKAYRENKIKSKKFHRIQRKERIKNALKEFDELKKTDPYAALEKLDQLDRTRVKERMTLRHKSTGQWAKNKQIRAKYDSNSRQMLSEQLSISRNLMQKIKINESSEEDDDNNDQKIGVLSSSKDNPWIKSANNTSEINEFINSYRKYWGEVSEMKNENIVSKDMKKIADNINKNDEEFQELKRDMYLSENFVNKVTEQYLPEKYNNSNKEISSIYKINDKTHSSDNTESMKEINNAKNKLNKILIKKPVNIKTFKKSSGTSSWLVSSTGILKNKILNEVRDIDLDEIFESVDDKLQKKIGKKHSKLKCMVDQETKYFVEIGNKKKKDITTCDIKKLSLKGQMKLKPMIDKPIEESESYESSNVSLKTDQIVCNNVDNCITLNSNTSEIDPNRFINIKSKCLKTLIPDNVGEEDEVLDNEDVIDQFQIISEAFADDNIVEEFRDKKKEEGEKRQLEDADQSLPGWGSWGGKSIKQRSRKKQRIIIRVSKEETRRDENKGDVVIIQEKCSKTKQHLINELPFPFTNVQDFEANMRAPLGRDFVPEKIFNKLIQPAIKTKMGKIIEPMTENILVKTVNLKKKLALKTKSKDTKKSNKKSLRKSAKVE